MQKIIPPLLYLLCILGMVLLRNLIVLQEVVPSPYNYAGILLVIGGFIMTIVVRKQFDKLETEIHTFKKPKRMVTTGLFSISRNPIYLGFAISLFGVWMLLGTFLPLLGVLLFVVVTNFYYIPFEEQEMETLFNENYLNYRSLVRRWL